MKVICQICGSTALITSPVFSKFKRVTSDCKPWCSGGQLAICQDCSFVQSIIDKNWTEQAARIYKDYKIYLQGGGKEQAVFDIQNGTPSLRSELLLQRVCEHIKLPQTGHWLDIGCGNGSFLRAGSKALPRWQFSGSEVDNKYQTEVESIRNFEKLYIGDLQNVRFDSISLIHVLEHIPLPNNILLQLHDHLEEKGYLLIELPDCLNNPFLLLVADHCLHFCLEAAEKLVQSSGYEISHSTCQWIPKEITIIARKSFKKSNNLKSSFPAQQNREIFSRIEWLSQVRKKAYDCHSKTPFGIFGSSIAATWLYAELDGKIDFFVDEDPNRLNHFHCGKPILNLSQIPKGSHVFIALPPKLAELVASRISKPGLTCYLPPMF